MYVEMDEICDRCAAFRGTGHTEILYSDGKPEVIYHIIRCEHKKVCDAIREAAGIKPIRQKEINEH